MENKQKNNKGMARCIPRILHQIWFDYGEGQPDPPAKFRALQRGLLDDNPGYTFYEWRYRAALKFIEGYYPEHFDWFLNLQYPVEKVDAFRFFLMHTYGGIYLDMDCKSLEPLDKFFEEHPEACRAKIVLVHSPVESILTNCVMMSAPGHEFWLEALKKVGEGWRPFWANWQKHAQILHTAGPYFLHRFWPWYQDHGKHYKRSDFYFTWPPVFVSKDPDQAQYIHHLYENSWVNWKGIKQTAAAMTFLLFVSIYLFKRYQRYRRHASLS